MRYEIIDLDCYLDENECYSVNDAHYTKQYVEIDNIDSNFEILKAVNESEYLINPIKNCYVDNISSKEHIYINAKSDDMPLIELELVKE